jgi:hypothetical protein
MKTNRISSWATAAIAVSGLALTAWAQPSGQWDFNHSNLTATVGADMTYADGAGGATELATRFGSNTNFGIPAINGTNAQVLRFPASVLPMGFAMPAPASPNGGGSLVNNYTLLVDLLYPAASNGQLRPLVETDGGALTAEADFVVSASGGIGTTEGPFFGSVAANTWLRLGIVVNGEAQLIKFYQDGALVGSTPITSPYDSRFALSPGGVAQWFAGFTTNAPGYVNSIQVRDVALTDGQMAAMGGPAAAGIPESVPAVPSYVTRWLPRGSLANRVTDVGAVIEPGDASVVMNTLQVKLDGVVQTGTQVSSNGTITVYKAAAGPLTAGTTHTVELTYTDSLAGAKTFTKTFKAAFLYEDFEELVLGDSAEEPVASTNAWTPTPPVGWVTNHSGMPGYGDPATDGRTEWAGWTFARKSFWLSADNQTRDQFTLGVGTLAIADSDEWDDAAHPQTNHLGQSVYFTSFLSTPAVNIAGTAPNSLFMKFDSSWRPEGFDDWGGTNNQTATVTVSYNNGAATNVLHWDSKEGGPFFHPDSQNEPVLIRLQNPAGATNIVVTFGLTLGGNDWWWAFDNFELNTGPVAPSLTLQPQSQIVSTGALVNFSVAATGSAPLAYQWRFNANPLPGQTGAALWLTNVQTPVGGGYSVIVTNEGGSVTSSVANLTIYSRTLTDGLVAHLKFDGNYDDATGRGNSGTPQGSPEFTNGWFGQAIHVESSRSNIPNNYVSLGYPEDFKFGSAATADAVDFSVAFWAKVFSQSDDKPFISNKDWDSGGNRGWVIASKSGGVSWNLRDDVSSRRDSSTVGPQLVDGGWHHVAVTFERADVARIYVDGVLLNTASMAPAAGAAIGSLDTDALGNVINLGQDGVGDYTDNLAASLNALMDDVGIWRRVITPEEVTAIYHAGFFSNDLAAATLYGPIPVPRITIQPTNQLASEGAAVSFSAAVLGGNPLSYQWRRDGTSVPGATNRILSIAAAGSTNAGGYTLVASNPGGSVTSSVATLTVLSAPMITVQPIARTNNQNLDISFTVTASGGGLAYQWMHFATNLPQGTNATLALDSIQPSQVGPYSVKVSNSGGTVVSTNADLVVWPIEPIRVTGQWDFQNGNLAATSGRALEFFDATVQTDTQYGTTTSFGIPDISGQPARVMYFAPSIATWGGLKMYPQTPANGGGTNVNRYTLIYDVLYPAGSHGKWRSFLQTSPGNANDAEFFVNSGNGIGISGNYQGVVSASEWHRIAFAVDLSSPASPAVAKYIDGVKVGYQTGLSGGLNGRFSLDTSALLFADEDGENSPVYVSSVQLRNGKMGDAAIAALGGASAGKIPGSIAITQVAGGLEIYRTGNAALEQASSLSGPWTEVVGAANPLVVTPGSGQLYFRPKY